MNDETGNEMVLLIKELVDRIKTLEQTVYDKDNILMKSGYVVAKSPTPQMSVNADGMPDSDQIAKMDWKDINKMVTNMEGKGGF